ncbi:MAG: GspMb/PilO family protein [Planctomycetota bacterium]|jgi:hypothetical protein
MTRADKKYVKNVALLWIACLAVFLPAYFLALVPQIQNRDRLRAELAQKERAHRNARDYAVRQARGAPAKEIEQLRQRFSDFVFDFEDSGDLTFVISEIATGKQVSSLGSIRVDERAEPGIPDCKRIAESAVDISFSAGFNQFLTLINALERNRPVVFVDTFTITRAKNAQAEHTVVMKLAVFLTKEQSKQNSDTTKVVRGTPAL